MTAHLFILALAAAGTVVLAVAHRRADRCVDCRRIATTDRLDSMTSDGSVIVEKVCRHHREDPEQ